MKLNIKSLLTGGRVYFSAVANPYSNSSLTSSESKTKDEGLISESLLNKLSEKGNPNDVENFMNMLYKFESNSNFGLGVNKSQLYKLKSYANQVIKQALYLESAEKRAELNGALDEYAVDSRGFLYTVGDKGEIKKVHASEFKYGEDTALTIGELILQRRFNPNEVDNESISVTVGSNIGTEKINDYILGIIKAIGSTDNSSEAYLNIADIIGRESAKRPSEQLQLTIRELYSLTLQLGPDAIFKVKDQYKSKNIEEAMNYIINMLPNNMKTLLIARNVVNGGKYENSSKYAMDIIASALNASNDVKLAHGIDYNQSINKAAGTEAGTKSQTKNLGVMQLLVLGSLGKRDYQLISSKNPTTSMVLHGTGVGSLADFDNNIIDKTPLSIAMQNSLAPLVDQNHIFMGDQKINSGYFDTILYSGGDVINIWAPVDSQGDIDFDQLKVFTQLQDVIKNNPQLTNLDKNQLLQEYGFSGQFDDLGVYHGSGNMALFLVMTGLTSDEVIDSETNLYADKLNSAQKDLEMPLIDRIYGYLNKGIKSKDGLYKFQKGWFNFTTDLVKAPIFMKLNNTAQIDVGTFSNLGPAVQTPTYQLQLAYDLMKYTRDNQLNNFVRPSTALLYE